MTFRPMPVLTLCTLACLIILILLGNWQYQRYTTKMGQPDLEEVQAEASLIEATVAADLGGVAQQVYGIMDGEAVWRRYVPARLSGSDTVVLALWDATGGPEPVALGLQDLDTTEFARLANLFVRPVERGRFAFEDKPDEGVWYTFNAAAMLAQYGVERAPYDIQVIETIDITVRKADDLSRARRTSNPYAYLEMRDPLPPQRHFGYALTWWGMAAGLLGVYLAFHHAAGRLRFRS